MLLAGNFGGMEDSDIEAGASEVTGASALVGGTSPTMTRPTSRTPTLRNLIVSRNYFAKELRMIIFRLADVLVQIRNPSRPRLRGLEGVPEDDARERHHHGAHYRQHQGVLEAVRDRPAAHLPCDEPDDPAVKDGCCQKLL